MSETTAIPVTGGELPVQLFLPVSGHGPGLVLGQEIFGVTPYIRRRAQDLADAGYVVAIPEVYWRLHQAPIDETSPAALDEAMGALQRLDFGAAVADMRSTAHWLAEQPAVDGAVGLIGFCFGGGLCYAAAAGDPLAAALVSYYGSALPQLVDQVPVVTAPSLHHFGDQDSYIPLDVQGHIRDVVTSQPDVTWHEWPGADHAFDNADFSAFHPDASIGAWTITLEWLHRTLPLH